MILIDERKYLELVRKASELRNQDDMHKFVQLMNSALAFDHFMFASMESDFSKVNAVFSTYPQAWVDAYTAEPDIENRDPLLRKMRRLKPVVWADIKSMTDDEKWFMDLRLRYGIGPNGLTLPFRSSDNRTSVLSVSQNGISAEDWIKKTSILKKELVEIGEILHSAYLHSLGITPPRVFLSPRIVACLQMKGTGMSDGDIAFNLQVSKRSVENYIEEAQTRLQASNIEMALATAIQMDLISIF